MSAALGTILLLLACALCSALVTALSIRYARRGALLDFPGRRRSHSIPTPRGGGIGFVFAVLAALALFWLDGRWQAFAVAAIVSVSAVAAAGWIDDHRGLGVRVRLLVHLAAVVVLYFPLFEFLAFLSAIQRHAATPENWAVAALAALAASAFIVGNVWFINLHNFMDGIDGLLACQSLFVFLALAALVPGDGRLLLLLCAAAVAGFLPFNFPRARVFMGDVGSGTLGLLIAGAVVLQAASLRASAFSGLIACSAFVTDASCTLLSRLLRGRRWYSAHREHLYQWLARCGFSHARVVALYMGWNLFVVVPVLYRVGRTSAPAAPGGGLGWVLAIYALATIAWIIGKRWCLLRAASMRRQ